MSKLKLSAQEGRALVLTLIVLGIGALLIPVFLSHASTNLRATRAIEEDLKEQYAADSGIEYALWQLQNEITASQNPYTYTINNKDVEVTWGPYPPITETYKITSTATSLVDGSNTTIVSYVRIAESKSDSSDSFAAFDYAIGSLDGDIDLTGSSHVYASGEGAEHQGNVYATGNVYLSGSAYVDGVASATGTVNKTGSSGYYDKQEGVPPLVGPEVDTQTYKAEAQDVECAVCGDYTYTGTNWDPDPGVYEDPVHAKNKITINGSGTWTFKNTVCAGIDTNKDIDISGSTVVTFEGPVKVGRDLLIGGSGTVIFKGTVCVGRDLKISGSGNVIFEKPIKVERNMNYSGSGEIELGGTVYVGGDMDVSGSQYMPLGGTLYVCGEIDMSGSGFRGGETIIAEGNITLSGSQQLNDEDIPFVLSLGNEVKFSGSNWTSAIVYAPEGKITLTGSNKVYGALVGKSVKISGSVQIEYPMELRNHTDWPDVVDDDDDEGGELEILTYNINP